MWREDRAGIGPEIRRRVLRLLSGTSELTQGPGGDSWSLGDVFARELYSGPGQHALVVGASGSGKSLRAAIRAGLEHLGATVVVSTKLDPFDPVALGRRLQGRGMRIFAPTLKLDDERAANWSPLSGCAVSEYALHMGRWTRTRTSAREMAAASSTTVRRSRCSCRRCCTPLHGPRRPWFESRIAH